MPQKRQVYLLDPQKFNSETIAVAFAKTSRSPETFQHIADELTDEKSAKFNEKWVVGYGHSSVAEHATLHIAVENVSRLAVETLQANRLASYTEKSTRYQKWDADSFHVPAELENHALKSLYEDTCQMLFSTYRESLEVLRKYAGEKLPQEPEEKESSYERRLRTQYVDVARFLLPASSVANVGVTINARSLEHALCKMFSHPLAEVRAMGEDIKAIAIVNVPTLVKYAKALPYLQNVSLGFKDAAKAVLSQRNPKEWCTLVDYDKEGEHKVLAAVLYRYSEISYLEALQYVDSLRIYEKLQLAETLLRDCEQHATPLRELEHASFSFDLVLDQGAYYELKRHRMMTQSPQELTTLLGYATPRWMVDSGFGDRYYAAMQAADKAYRTLAEFNPAVASYVVPNGFNRRVLLTLNLRTADHLFALRSASNAHFSIRRVAQRMNEEITRVYPMFGPMLRCSEGETAATIEDRYFSATF